MILEVWASFCNSFRPVPKWSRSAQQKGVGPVPVDRGLFLTASQPNKREYMPVWVRSKLVLGQNLLI